MNRREMLKATAVMPLAAVLPTPDAPRIIRGTCGGKTLESAGSVPRSLWIAGRRTYPVAYEIPFRPYVRPHIVLKE